MILGRRFARAVVVILAGVATGIALLELLFGGNRLNPLSIPVGVDLRLDVSDLYSSEEPTVRYRRDRYGFRGKYTHPSTIDILTLGGSTADQRFLDESSTWQSVMAASFEEAGEALEVVNAGVDGQSTVGNLANFFHWFPAIPELRPKYVLVYVGTNDLFLDGTGTSRFDQLERGGIADRILKRSALFDLYRKLKGIYLAERVLLIGHGSLRLDEVAWTMAPVRVRVDWPKEASVIKGFDEFEERLRALHDQIIKLRAKAIFVTQQSRYDKQVDGAVWGIDHEWKLFGLKGNGVDLGQLMSMQFERTMAVCRDLGAVCVDTTALKYDDGDFYDVVHHTPSGAAKLGRFLYGELASIFPVAEGPAHTSRRRRLNSSFRGR